MTISPLRFEPIYQYRLWGGQRLYGLLKPPLPGSGPIGEAWVLSDRDDRPSLVANGPLKGRSIAQVLEQFPKQMMGELDGRFRRFPLLACIYFAEHPAGRVTPVMEGTAPVECERVFHCEYFRLWRLHGHSPFSVGAAGVPRILVCLECAGQLEHGGATDAIGKDDVWLLPAVTGACTFRPSGPVSVLEIAMPE
jgi:mannose-6-phosphate isomerase class I